LKNSLAHSPFVRTLLITDLVIDVLTEKKTVTTETVNHPAPLRPLWIFFSSRTALVVRRNPFSPRSAPTLQSNRIPRNCLGNWEEVKITRSRKAGKLNWGLDVDVATIPWLGFTDVSEIWGEEVVEKRERERQGERERHTHTQRRGREGGRDTKSILRNRFKVSQSMKLILPPVNYG